MNLEKRSNEIKARITEIKGLIGTEVTLEVLEELEAEVDELQEEEEETIERKLAGCKSRESSNLFSSAII